ncbi:hypothetical protein DSCW_01210 [Desulfosarcina widdelii]|uniref:Protein kinase domain-containing protein n=1 Tax=Desulfosarcina widdelii TaxID=947919 RepID=A0A5K7Z2J6_9BACT|nr:hypothetical protein [Desulfosarcina widdelii]BBO72704.1 hypothetical protein DSCW_01210 [Desulfosarcina widdelii]
MDKGFRFGNRKSYLVLDKLGNGFEGTVYAVYSKKELKAAKITIIGEETIYQCSSYSRSEFDLRRSHPFKPLPAKWYSCADDDLKNEVIDVLKLLKQQHALHSQIQRKKIPWLIPPLQDYGLLLLPSDDGLTPATWEIYPLVQGQTLKRLLDNLNDVILMQSFLNTGRIRAGIDAKAAYSRLADMVIQQLTHGIEILYKHGFAIAEIDLHPSNLLFGAVDGGANRVYLIDNRLCAEGCGCNKDELLNEIEMVGGHIRDWHKKGMIYSAYYNSLIDDI